MLNVVTPARDPNPPTHSSLSSLANSVPQEQSSGHRKNRAPLCCKKPLLPTSSATTSGLYQSNLVDQELIHKLHISNIYLLNHVCSSYC